MASALLAFALAAVAKLEGVGRSLAGERLAGEPFPDPFLSNLVRLLSDVQERLKEIRSHKECISGSDVEKSILKLLFVLENLVRWPRAFRPTPKPPFRRNDYTWLDHLDRVSQIEASTNIRKLAKSLEKRAPIDRRKFHNFMEAFSGKQLSPQGPPLSDLVTRLTPSAKSAGQDEYSACLGLLHATLCRCSGQADYCGGGFTANVALTRVRGEANDEVIFDCFFLHRHPNSTGDKWKEARIRVVLLSDESRPAPRVRWLSAGTPVSPQDFCGLIRRPEPSRLILNAASDGLSYHNPDLNIDRLFFLDESSVSLAAILEKRKLHGNKQLKLLLSYLIAKAVWQFYDSAWMTPYWTKDAIHFMRDRRHGSREILTLIHKPYFTTELRPSPPDSGWSRPLGDPPRDLDSMQKFSSATHLQPKILALGIMLLEIESGTGMEQHRAYGAPTQIEDQLNAWSYISSDLWRKHNTYQALTDIIKTCLQPELPGMDQAGDDKPSVCDSLYTHVVAPLGRLFRKAWSQDQEPESFDPGPIYFKPTELPSESIEAFQAELLPVENTADVTPGPTPAELQSPSLSPSLVLTSHPRASQDPDRLGTEIESSCSEDGELWEEEYDAKSVEARRKRTDKWFYKFQKLLVAHGLLGREGEKRIKLAILDSGINITHPHFSDEDRLRVVERVSFIGGDPEQDSAGHGTHIATVILRLTKNVDLYIGKITNTRSFSRRENIAEAIEHARTKWRVDMISLSFGFKRISEPDMIGPAVEECLHKGIVVFASASNERGEGSRTYPASIPHVICVHSATCQGQGSACNPVLETQQRNYSFVGEHVRPAWGPGPHTAGDSIALTYRSGTSYATPVAVSVAAFMIGYIHKKMPDHPWRIKPWSPFGIEAIFNMMAVKEGEYDWVSPTRYMEHTIEEKIQADLKQKLGAHVRRA